MKVENAAELVQGHGGGGDHAHADGGADDEPIVVRIGVDVARHGVQDPAAAGMTARS